MTKIEPHSPPWSLFPENLNDSRREGGEETYSVGSLFKTSHRLMFQINLDPFKSIKMILKEFLKY